MAYQSPLSLARARSLRRDETLAEQRLWERLRARRLGGCKFVRQLQIGPYFADFACRALGLVVEVDGATHGADHELARDAARTRYLENEGWQVMRVWNGDVLGNIDGVCDAILLRLEMRKG